MVIKGKIYKLVHPKTKAPIYVGSTKRALRDRLKEHMYDNQRKSSLIYDYLQSEKIKPEIVLVEEVEVQNSKELVAREVYWIDKFTSEGHKIYNVNRTAQYSGSVKVDWAIYDLVKEVCRREGMSISRFYDIAVIARLKKFGVVVEEKDPSFKKYKS
jgi:thiamine biosynthesis lipoprotein ApbE